MLGHELTHIRNGDVRMMVIAVVIAGVISFFGELVFRLFFQAVLWRRRPAARRRRRRPQGGGAGIAIVIALALIAVAWILSIVIRFALSRAARISRRCRLGRAHQKSRRHDLGAAQDRGPRRNHRAPLPR